MFEIFLFIYNFGEDVNIFKNELFELFFLDENIIFVNDILR